MPRNITATVTTLALLLTVTVAGYCAAKGKAYTDPAAAAAEDPDFNIQGEYAGKLDEDGEAKPWGVQVVALGDGKFVGVALPGGLPGDGWVGKDAFATHATRTDDGSVTFNHEGAKAVLKNGVMTVHDKEGKKLGTLSKITRKSPTEGAAPPAGATVLFDGTEASLKHWAGGKMDDGLLTEGTKTAAKFGSFKLHLEFRLPYKPTAQPSSQDRGNSGVYTFNRYETQLLDSFGLHYNNADEGEWKKAFEKDWGFGPKSDRKQWCACFYKFKLPQVNAAYPPLAWQTYDITFTAPKFDGDGKKTANARFTVVHNGVTVHDDVEMVNGGTGAGGGRPEVATEGIYLQGHGNPVRFRNIWIKPLD